MTLSSPILGKREERGKRMKNADRAIAMTISKTRVEMILTLVLRRGGCKTPNSFRPSAQNKTKGKKFEPATGPGGRVNFQSWEVGGWCKPMIL